eukprot:symbB.v1.2.004854.t1/scaffold280.1/size241228/4
MVDTLTPRRAAHYLHVQLDAEEVELRRAFRHAARRCHPDKQGSTEEFLKLQEALEVLLQRVGDVPVSSRASTVASATTESERLDKHFFGTHFGSDHFDPRAWSGEVTWDSADSADLLQCVWRCRRCVEESSVCCRLKVKKHLCLCGHKLEAHLRPGFGCGHNNCRCHRFEFYVQQLGWEARCSCKHHVRDHQQLNGSPWPCNKVLPGKEKKPCPCKGFNISWVCTCGHQASDHETTWQRKTSKAAFAREWVAQGLRPECVAEAEEKRARWQSRAAARAVETSMDLPTARAAVKATAKRMQVSMCAEAKMMEAVEETFDGTRLPGSRPLSSTKHSGSGDGERTRRRELQRSFGIEDKEDGTFVFAGGHWVDLRWGLGTFISETWDTFRFIFHS